MKQITITFLTIWILILFSGCSDSNISNEDTVVIIGAFNEEIEYLVENMNEPEKVIIEGLQFTKGIIHEKTVIVGISGIGKVNAAMTTALVIESFHPGYIIFTGIAGGLNPLLCPGDLIIGERTVQHDLLFIGSDTIYSYIPKNPLTGQLNPVYFNADSNLFAIALQAAKNLDTTKLAVNEEYGLPKVMSGTIVSGDAFIASSDKKGDLISRFHADAVEMEGAAVAQVCYQFNVPCLVIRSISDSADDKAKVTLETFYKQAAQNSAELVMAIVGGLEFRRVYKKKG
ncbi:MAG: 5'-methylthioadenosine/adenosylhomocysteine nucleosidase [Bacteroidales bacterium]|nr:5'-methylthioadenosine/adenosylhomocysteine nucleosidase [Bacteroidales bacterium]